MPPSLEPWQPPAGAVRDGELEAWEVSEHDAGGLRNGVSTLYRDDGSVLLSCRYETGKRSGPFRSYHPNGDIESEGSYVDGTLDGAFVRYASERPGGTPLRDCCVPPGARALRVTYQRGMSFGETFYDGVGRALRSNGTPQPERAPGLPDAAMFEESEERWVHRFASEDGATFRRSYDLDGRLVEEVESIGVRRVALREFSRSGLLVREHRFDDAGLLHGPCLLLYGDDDAPYADRAIREVRGAFEHGQAVGAWRFLDAAGRELRVQDRGIALSDEQLGALLGRESSVEIGQFERLTALASERRVREALFHAARGAGREGRAERLVELLRASIVPLRREVALARALAFDREVAPNLRDGLDALLAGAEPAEIFRLLATLVPPVRSAARDLAEVALLLAPKNDRPLVTRALIRLEQGDDRGALTDIGSLGAEFGEAAAQVREHARVLFPKFSFSPRSEPPPEPNPALTPVAVEQPLDVVRRTIALYATRLGMIRGELRRRLDAEPEWLPPDLSELLETGPSELRRFSATITDEEEGGSETSEVQVDETLELEDSSAASLMIVARGDWDALSWLCWSVGLDEIALPAALAERPGFSAAVNEAMQRCFRAHDQVRTAGLVSRARGVASFDWEGLPVDALPGRLAEIAAHQYLERRALFFYLLFPQNLSPFQRDLRSA